MKVTDSNLRRFLKPGDTPSDLLRRAAAARRIAEEVLNPLDKKGLREMAEELEAEALRQQRGQRSPTAASVGALGCTPSASLGTQ